MRKHVDNGGECLKSLSSERRDLTWQIIHSHHENFDGSGYPDRARGPDYGLIMLSEDLTRAKLANLGAAAQAA